MSNVSVCVMPVVLPVAALFSKTMVAGPAVAVSGADLYAVMLLSAVQVSTWSAACAAVSWVRGCAVAWIDGQTYVAPTCELNVLDRVGGGDGFASGLFCGLLTGEPSEEAVKLGWAHGALLTTFPGDTTMATVEQVRAFAKGGSARIQR